MLTLGPDLSLDVSAATQTFAILAIRGAGKTYLALVMAEELLAAKIPTVILDPTGVCWGLRVDADGKAPGLPVYVFGGERGDLPLPSDGAAMADFVVDEAPSVVLDLSELSIGEQQRFVTAFCERLYLRKAAQRWPLHLILDEADEFAPQRPMKGQERMLGAVQRIVRRGRTRGLGVTLVTQRPASLHKDVLTQCPTLFALRMVGHRDLHAIHEWVEHWGSVEDKRALLAELPTLRTGTAWIWSPGWLGEFRKIEIRRRRTYDSSATPDSDKSMPTVFGGAKVDVERARARFAEKDKKADVKTSASAVEIAEERRLRILAEAALAASERRRERLVDEIALAIRCSDLPPTQATEPNVQRVHASSNGHPPAAAGFPDATLSEYALHLYKTVRSFHPIRLTRRQLALLSGRSPKSSAYSAAYQELVRAQRIWLDGSGRVCDRQPPDALRGAADVLSRLREVLPAYERSMLDAVWEGSGPITADALASRIGRSKTSSAFSAALSTLVANEVLQRESGGLVIGPLLSGAP